MDYKNLSKEILGDLGGTGNINSFTNCMTRLRINVKNPDLWKRMVPLLKKHTTTFHWIKGHAGHPENEICDQLAVKAAQSDNLETDTFFENQQNGGLF